MNGWQPIETAPRDGTEILAFGLWAGEIAGPQPIAVMALISWGGDGDYPGYEWDVSGGDAYACWMKPSHWQPLPEPPQ
jgi:hypothetical protein